MMIFIKQKILCDLISTIQLYDDFFIDFLLFFNILYVLSVGYFEKSFLGKPLGFTVSLEFLYEEMGHLKRLYLIILQIFWKYRNKLQKKS